VEPLTIRTYLPNSGYRAIMPTKERRLLQNEKPAFLPLHQSRSTLFYGVKR
jgi:hypothetical protein